MRRPQIGELGKQIDVGPAVATPKPVIAQLEAALRKTMSDSGVVQLLAEMGTEAVGSAWLATDGRNINSESS